MTVKQAECHIAILPTLGISPTRKRMAEVSMDIFAGMCAGPQPIKLVIKGKNFRRVMELMTLHEKPDADIAQRVRESVLSSEVEGMTDEEAAAWARASFVQELKDMSEE